MEPTNKGGIEVGLEEPGTSSRLCEVHWHKWRVEKDTGAVRYEECRRCWKRRAVVVVAGHQPLDYEWLREWR